MSPAHIVGHVQGVTQKRPREIGYTGAGKEVGKFSVSNACDTQLKASGAKVLDGDTVTLNVRYFVCQTIDETVKPRMTGAADDDPSGGASHAPMARGRAHGRGGDPIIGPFEAPDLTHLGMDEPAQSRPTTLRNHSMLLVFSLKPGVRPAH